MDVQDIRKACTETLIIGLLRERPMHGYEMAKEIERRSEGYFRFKHATLYPALHRLEKQGLIAGAWQGPDEGRRRPRKHYRLTPRGASWHESNTSEWQEFFAAMATLIPELAR